LSGNGNTQPNPKRRQGGRKNKQHEGPHGPKRPDRGPSTGAALGSAVLRYSGIHGLGMVLSNIITFASTIVMANFTEPAGFGQLGLLMFYSGLLTLIFTLASKQGTLKRTFGGDDEDEEDEEEDEDDEGLSTDPRKSFGAGLITITVVSLIGTGLSIIFAQQIVDGLLGGAADPSLIVWAALAGGAGALYRLASIAIWIERRPYSYIAVETMKPLFTLVAVVSLLVAGLGVEGAIAGHALGMLLGTVMSLIMLRGSWTPTFDLRETWAIYRKGAVRVPLVLSMWIVGYADIFILSKFVAHSELGIYHLASKAAFLVAILPGGFRKALRPLQKTPMFRAVEDQYGVGTARGAQFGYFTIMLAGTMLATTVMATVMVRVAPPAYANAAPLIPLISGGLVAPTVYRMINKSVKYGDKRVPFIFGAIFAMLAFIGLSLLLIPQYGVKGTPLAMMLAFAGPTIFVFIKSQRGRTPIRLPWRSMIISSGLAVAVAFAHAEIDPGGIVTEILWGIVALIVWAALCLLLGAIPKEHRAALWHVVKGLRDRGHGFEPAAGLEGLSPRERKVLRRAIVRGMPPKRAAKPLLEGGNANGAANGANGWKMNGEAPSDVDRANAMIVDLLRRAAVAGGAPGIPDDYERTRRRQRQRDAYIGAFLFAQGTIAERDQIGKRLINDGVADSFDLHTLEAVIGSLQRAGKPLWREGGG
jgi:O-antigen/teichoic acid export membrane protein